MGFPDADFEHFFLRHYDQVVRSLTAVTGDRETAKDCSQDGFVKAAARWRKVRKLDDPVGWVRRVAINRSRDIHRSEERRRGRETLVAEAQPMRTSDGGADIVAGQLRLEQLLALLPRQQRAAAALFYVDDLGIAEIADLLGLSRGAVKFHLNKARETLRGVLADEGQEIGYGA